MKKIAFGLIPIIVVILGVSFIGQSKRQPEPHRSPQGIIPPSEIQDALRHAFDAAPDVEARARIRRDMQRVKQKSLSPAVPEENPGAFIEALAQVKTAYDGKTYKSGYRAQVFRQALARKRKNFAALPWVERGPGNVAGRARAVLFDPRDADGDTWISASVGGGIWKTEDRGQTWTDCSPDFLTLSTTCLAMCASNPDIIYAGTGMGYGRIVDLSGSGIWKTVDGGVTWFQLSSTANGELLEAVNRIVVDPDDPDLVLACTNDGFSHLGPKGGTRRSGIFRSTDGGTTWTQVYDPDDVLGTQTDNRIQQVIANPDDFDELYATVNEVGVIKSNDAGLTWRVVADHFALPSDIGNPPNGGFGLAGISVRTELAIAPTEPNRIYAAVERPRGVADVYMSRDAGESWVLLDDTSGDPNWFNAFGQSGATGSYTSGWFNNTIIVHPYDANVVFVGGVNIYRIEVNVSNGSRTSTPIAWWTFNSQGIPYSHADHHFFTVIPVNQATGSFRILDANDGGVAYSLNGGVNWVQTTGLGTTQFYGADKMPGESVYIGGMQDNGTWRSGMDPGPTSAWTFALGGDGFEVAWNQENPDLVLGCTQYGNIHRSTDGGFSWTGIPSADIGNAPFITKIASSKIDPDLVFVIGSNGVNRSEDFGLTWSRTPVSGRWLGYRPFDNVEISEADPQIVWITSRLTVDPPSGIQGGIHVSQDGGLSFLEITDSLPNTLTESSGLATHPLDGNTAYLLFSAPGLPKVLRTTDLGQTWQDLSAYDPVTRASDNGFPDVAVFSLLVMPFDPQQLWAGTEVGLFISEDGGASWEYADNGLPHVGIFQMRIVDDQVVVATQGRGIFSATLPELADVVTPDVTLAPRIRSAAMHPNGHLAVRVDLRSAYQQTSITVGGEIAETLEANSGATQVSLWLPVTETLSLDVQAESISQGRTYRSGTKQVTVFPTAVRTQYETDFDHPDAAQDFIGTGFSVITSAGFSNGALHTAHPYPQDYEAVFMLKVPIQVQQRTTLTYDDVVLVEPGSGSGVFGDPQFWDYVIVEGTRDGATWIPLADGYDSRTNTRWLNTYNTNGSGHSGLFVSHRRELTDVFDVGDQVFLRFRLFSDPLVTGWGWAIDNIRLESSGGVPDKPRRLLYPWISHNSQFESLLVANNIGSLPADVHLVARRADGTHAETVRTIPAHGFLRESAGSLFPEMGEGPGFSVVLESDHLDLQGSWVTYNLQGASNQSPSQGVAVAVPGIDNPHPDRLGTEILFGFLPVTQGLTSAPVIVNIGSGPTNVTLDFFDASGQLIVSDETALTDVQPFVPFARVANELVSGSDDVYLVARSDGQPITGVNFVFNAYAEPAIGNVSAINRDDSREAKRLVYPWVSQNAQFDSIVVVNNLDDLEVTLELSAQRGEGPVEQTTVRIAAHGFLAQTAGSLFPELGDGAGFSITLDAPSPRVFGSWVTQNLEAASGRSPSQGVAIDVRTDGLSSRMGRQIMFGFLPLTNGFTSAPVIVNLGDGPTDVSLDYFDRYGILLKTDGETLRSLDSYRPFATVANTLVPDAGNDICLIASSPDQPITGVGFVFNSGSEPAIGNVTRVTLE